MSIWNEVVQLGGSVHHKATIKKDEANFLRPFFASCSCGPQGNFETAESARAYLDYHLSKVVGINTKEFVDETDPAQIVGEVG